MTWEWLIPFAKFLSNIVLSNLMGVMGLFNAQVLKTIGHGEGILHEFFLVFCILLSLNWTKLSFVTLDGVFTHFINWLKGQGPTLCRLYIKMGLRISF